MKNDTENAGKGLSKFKAFVAFVKQYVLWACTVFAVLCLLVYLLICGIPGSRKNAEYHYRRAISSSMARPDNIELPQTSTVLKETYLHEIAETDNYMMTVYEEENSTVQKRTEAGKSTYYFRLRGTNSGMLDGKTCIDDGTAVYVLGEKKEVYYPTSSGYAPIFLLLQSYLPENRCLSGVFNKEVKSADEKNPSVLYGNDIGAVIDKTIFYEKNTDGMIVCEKRMAPPLAVKPDEQQCTVYR